MIYCSLIKLLYNTSLRLTWTLTATLNLTFSASSSVDHNPCIECFLCWFFPECFMAIQLSLSVFCAVCLWRFMGWSIRCRTGKGETELKPLKSWNASTEGIKSLKEMRGKPELGPVYEIPVLWPPKKSRLGLPSMYCSSGWEIQGLTVVDYAKAARCLLAVTGSTRACRVWFWSVQLRI